MSDSIVPDANESALTRKPSRMDGWARKLVLARLEELHWGRLTIAEGANSREFGSGRPDQPSTTVVVHSPGFFSAVAFRGSLGAAEAYIDGAWSCDDIVALIRIMIRNESVLRSVEGGWAKLAAPAARVVHRLRRNTRRGSRRNIAAHYDLGNEFYGLFLDATMTYSAGIFEREDATLTEAQQAKYDRLCRRLSLASGDRVAEIGCGWGGFAVYAASNYGCHVTGVTLSREQVDYARRRVGSLGLDDRIELRLQDYRDLTGTFDKLVSIEMIEAVGHQYLDEFFRVCSRLLVPDGQMALQAITIADQRYSEHLRTVDFMKRYIFPGGCLVSVSAVCDATTRATDLRPVELVDISPHYARTLRCWRQRFQARLGEVRSMGFPERFIRLWEYYLSYCEGAFTERYVGDVQMIFQKPLCRTDRPT